MNVGSQGGPPRLHPSGVVRQGAQLPLRKMPGMASPAQGFQRPTGGRVARSHLQETRSRFLSPSPKAWPEHCDVAGHLHALHRVPSVDEPQPLSHARLSGEHAGLVRNRHAELRPQQRPQPPQAAEGLSMISWTARRSKLLQTSARNSHVSPLRLRADPSLRMLKEPMSTEPYSFWGRPYHSGAPPAFP